MVTLASECDADVFRGRGKANSWAEFHSHSRARSIEHAHEGRYRAVGVRAASTRDGSKDAEIAVYRGKRGQGQTFPNFSGLFSCVMQRSGDRARICSPSFNVPSTEVQQLF